MPKYKPTDEEMYQAKSCGYCGLHFIPIFEGEEYCDDSCERMAKSAKEDWEYFNTQELLRQCDEEDQAAGREYQIAV